MMRVLHAYCLNYNIGDYFLGIGVKNLLRHFLNVDLIAETNLQGTVFDEYYIDSVVNKKYDLLVIGGGGIIHGAHWPNGWFWLIDEDLIDRIKIPFIVFGAGYNYFENEGGIPEIGVRHLKKTIARSSFFSLRNDESADRFKAQLGIDVPEIPDPGFHIGLNRRFDSPESDPYVVVQLADDKPEFRFGSESNRVAFANNMKSVVRYLSNLYAVVLAPHVYEDIGLCREVAQGISNVRVWDFSTYAFDRCAECVGFYRDAHFVLAMRGHGQIVPLSFDTPVISIENHPKHGGLMRRLGLEAYNVSIGSIDFCEELLQKVGMLEADRKDYVTHLGLVNRGLYRDTQKAFDIIRERLPAF